MERVKVLVGLLIFLISLFVLPTSLLAAGEFATDYNVSYDVDSSGVTTVTEIVTLRNLTDQYFASTFDLAINATNISELSATSGREVLETETTQDGNRTNIKVKFKQQIVGQDKSSQFTLKFKTPDFASNRGQVWQVMIPRAPKLEPTDNFALKLMVPVGFGDPTTIVPQPVNQRESGGKITLDFNKDQIQQSGVQASFGDEQQLVWWLKYQLNNNGILPELMRVPLPPNTTYQTVLINSLTPQPENMTIDGDGNYLAWYKVEPRQQIPVEASGQAQLKARPNPSSRLSSVTEKSLVKTLPYWEANNPVIKDRLNQIFGEADLSRLSATAKAEPIHRFVAGFLAFDRARLGQANYERLGALTAQNNPGAALSGEYADLFVSLARAAGVPARRLEGYAYSSNQYLKPLSLPGQLHAWAEYYDVDKGWVMVDPAWENTSGGVDYFNRFDLDHLVLVIEGEKSVVNYPTPELKVELDTAPFSPREEARLSLQSTNNLIAGWPSRLGITAQNIGNSFIPASTMIVKSQVLAAPLSEISVPTPPLPPYGSFTYNASLRSVRFWEFQKDQIEIQWQNASLSQAVEVQPFYHNQWVVAGLALFGVVVVGFYILALILHVRILRHHKHK